MKNIAVIPARGGSKRLPKKNCMLLNGIPLLAHSIIYAQNNASIINEVYVSTDDSQIKEIALFYGAKVIERPAELSGDNEPTVSALKHVIQNIHTEVDNVILLQATNPLRPENLLKECYDIFLNSNNDSLFTVSRNHYKFGKIEDGVFFPFNYSFGQRSQDLEALYYENGLLYISKAKLILDDTIVSKSAYPYEVASSFPIIDIDTQTDFEFANYLIKNIKL